MTTKLLTKPAICITFDRSTITAQHSADIVGHTTQHTAAVEQKIIDAIENAYPMIQVYVENRDNKPLVQMSTTARRLCGATDAQIEAIIDEVKFPRNPVGAPRQMADGKRVNVYLDAASLSTAATLGSGNVSEGIRKSLARKTMITINATNATLAAHAETIMAHEVMRNPDLNGANYQVQIGDFNEVDGADEIVAAVLYQRIFRGESEE